MNTFAKISFLFFLLTMTVITPPVFGQARYSDIKATMILTLSNNVYWPITNQKDVYSLGVSKEDSTLYNLLQRLVKITPDDNKRYVVKILNDITDVEDVDILFVNKNKSKDLHAITQLINRKNILLISEQSKDLKNIMLNIIWDEQTQNVSFEINKANMVIEGFNFSDELVLLGGREIDVREMYRDMKIQLETEKTQSNSLRSEIQKQIKTISSQNLAIGGLKDSIENLTVYSDSLLQGIEKNQQSLLDLLDQEQNQKAILANQLKLFENQSDKIVIQDSLLGMQKEQIAKSELVLDSLYLKKDQLSENLKTNQAQLVLKDNLIKIQKKLLIVSIVFAILLIIIGAIAIRAYFKKQKLAYELESSNQKLNIQHKRILELNVELSHSNKKLKKINKDITEQKETLRATLDDLEKAQTQLIQSEKMSALGVLTAGVAHEINNPLNFINSGVIALRSNFNNGDSDQIVESNLDKIISGIEIGVERVKSIVTSLGAFSHQTSIGKDLCNINAVIEDCLIILHHEYKNNIEIVKKLNASIPFINGNQSQLYQVVINLLMNAVQAIKPNKGEITIKTEVVNEKQLLISIKDNGVGMDPETLSKIFDPFFTTKSTGSGVGLGLTIIYSIIKDHKGTIHYKSKESKGTKVEVMLPI